MPLMASGPYFYADRKLGVGTDCRALSETIEPKVLLALVIDRHVASHILRALEIR
jgi:hypothetical protein